MNNWRDLLPLIEAGARRPMEEAPRDGATVFLERRPNHRGRQPKDMIVPARWLPNAPGVGHAGRRVLLLEWRGSGGQDEKYLGWWPVSRADHRQAKEG
jgi:hypothetical protein